MSKLTPSLVMDVTETLDVIGEVSMNSLMAMLIGKPVHATWTTSDPDGLHDEAGLLRYNHLDGELHVNGRVVYTYTDRPDGSSSGIPSADSPVLTIF